MFRLRSIVVTAAFGSSFLWLNAQTPAKPDFARDIRPLLRDNCYSCHGPSLQNGGFRLDRRRDPMPNRVGANGARIVPGNSAASRVYVRVSESPGGLRMPPTGALKAEEIALIKTWIDQGAEWPDELAGEEPSPPQDPQATLLTKALRDGDRTRFEKLLRANPKAASAKGLGGSTPLMYAALYGSADAVRLLLQNGATPNTRNDVGATALLWAVDDAERTRLLLDAGADPNAVSDDGRTPLVLAAARLGSTDVVQLLLDKGAKVTGQPVLARAATAGDATLMRLLLSRGAETRPLPQDLAIRTGCSDCVQMVLQYASPADLNSALAVATRYGDSNAMRMLIDRGAQAASGAPGLAAVATPDLKMPAAPRSVRAAIEKSLPALQHADIVFLKTAGCVSCHNNSLFLMTATAVRKKGFRVDDAAVKSQLKLTASYIESFRERVLQDIGIPGNVDTVAYILTGLAAANYPPDAATDAMARFLKRRQAPDGGWRIAAQRPPIESSDITATATALRSLRAYAPKPIQVEYSRAILRATTWLAEAQAQTTEDHALQLLGLLWGNAPRENLRPGARSLVALQKPDGGWSQIPSLPSDAYATGQALTALAETGSLSVADPVYQRGVQYLLKAQLEDGSWYVRSRANPVQPYFDSEFPHGKDQFISAAATNWAVMALARAAR